MTPIKAVRVGVGFKTNKMGTSGHGSVNPDAINRSKMTTDQLSSSARDEADE